MSEEQDADRWNRGLEMVDQVYGQGSSSMMQGMAESPFVGEIVRHLFGEIWSRSALSMRDKRLLVIGATAMLGRADLVTIQIAGAIANGELTEAQLAEIPLLMLFYAGAGKSTALQQGIMAAQAKAKAQRPTG
jgi:4-carboxymuconolactone decarboxylase